jgi:hypothetical protein
MAGSRWWQDFDVAVAATLPPGSRVLDVGCGDGALVHRLTSLGFDAFGVVANFAQSGRAICANAVDHAAVCGMINSVRLGRLLSGHPAPHPE